MSANSYHFVTHWRMPGSKQEIFNTLADARELTRWWPSVYLDVRELEPGNGTGVGKVVSLYTKGWLPYTLRWQFRVTEVQQYDGFSLEAWGDFVGRGVWQFAQSGEWVDITYDWSIEAEKPILRRLSFILKPIFGANHQWAMRQGAASLELELARRRVGSEQEQLAIPQPPGPTFAFLL